MFTVICEAAEFVSIHAPTGGATCFADVDSSEFRFQSTRPRGARLNYRGRVLFHCLFQSTRPRGARRDIVFFDWDKNGFNPRAHGGRDEDKADELVLTLVSIHAPTGGATRGQPRVSQQ